MCSRRARAQPHYPQNKSMLNCVLFYWLCFNFPDVRLKYVSNFSYFILSFLLTENLLAVSHVLPSFRLRDATPFLGMH